jgi:hypothetical protein
MEYIFRSGEIVHVLKTKVSENSKLGIGFVVHTYHWSIDQISTGLFTNDANNCLDCPYSYNQNNGKSGGCYTHGGMQGQGLRSMLKRLHKLFVAGKIESFNKDQFNNFLLLSQSFNPVLTRLGVYGEPITLPLNVMGKLVRISKAHTGYTHQWNKDKATSYNKYLMASTHNIFETMIAEARGFRAFQSSKDKDTKMPVCPASKEMNYKLTCIQCKACDGKVNGKTKSIFIHKH